ncbi:hypothetical protein OG555_17265 [Kribbella sp. NBC_01484]|uniref:hypothetical protein n=1 Tax=Kribbella sp. NBC_01484 TaxID=2903579 RepID=UPI002E324233|nr:hypothetical protein [Kribbella sp. NBC_01484]
MTKTFSREMLTKALALFGPLLGVATIGGPVLAGFIISVDLFGLSWRPIFLINLALGVIGLAVAVRILPYDDGDHSTVVDGWGSGLLAGAMFGLLYGLIEGSTNGWTRIPMASIVAGLAFSAAFAHRQSTAADPLLKTIAAEKPRLHLRPARRARRLRRHDRAGLRAVAVPAGGTARLTARRGAGYAAADPGHHRLRVRRHGWPGRQSSAAP